jgi:hypothetical protein
MQVICKPATGKYGSQHKSHHSPAISRWITEDLRNVSLNISADQEKRIE